MFWTCFWWWNIIHKLTRDLRVVSGYFGINILCDMQLEKGSGLWEMEVQITWVNLKFIRQVKINLCAWDAFHSYLSMGAEPMRILVTVGFNKIFFHNNSGKLYTWRLLCSIGVSISHWHWRNHITSTTSSLMIFMRTMPYAYYVSSIMP